MERRSERLAGLRTRVTCFRTALSGTHRSMSNCPGPVPASTSAATWDGSAASKSSSTLVQRRTPTWPASTRAQTDSAPQPSGVTNPIPLTTTRRRILYHALLCGGGYCCPGASMRSNLRGPGQRRRDGTGQRARAHAARMGQQLPDMHVAACTGCPPRPSEQRAAGTPPPRPQSCGVLFMTRQQLERIMERIRVRSRITCR